MRKPVATILITTRNRCSDLQNALASALAQTGPVEVVVIDDCSSDSTVSVVRERFPAVRIHTSGQPYGYVVQRNRGVALARAPIVISLDDDATFSAPHTVERTVTEFDHPRIGAVAIPYIDMRGRGDVRQRAPTGDGVWITPWFRGTAHALRRDLFLGLGGYRAQLMHQGEERDYCIRLLDTGYVIRLGHAPPIHHFESEARSLYRMDFYGRRNDVLYAWQNVPWPYLALHLPATTLRGVMSGARARRPGAMLRGAIAGYASCSEVERRPVRRVSYRLSRKLQRRPARIEDIEGLLPPQPGRVATTPPRQGIPPPREA